MLDLLHLPSKADVQQFIGTSQAAGGSWQTWMKPRGKSMCHILLIGKGGNGGTGVIGANSVAAGGGGGGSGSQISLTLPLWAIPDMLYLSLAGQSNITTLASYITIGLKLTSGAGAPVANDTLAYVNGGANGGNASAGTAGTAGSGGVVSAAGTMPYGWQWADSAIAGQTGQTGGANVAPASPLALPNNGLLVTGGLGGGGLPAAGTIGTSGGARTGSGVFPGQSSAATTAATTPPLNGDNGYMPLAQLLFGYGGGGGASTHGTATGEGLVQSKGGHGAPGCGGGGMGGALTGSAAGAVGMGGPSFCIITCW